jgi:hypothetical protein
MFSIVTIDGDKCTLTAYVEDGRIIDMSTIDKEKDLITPYDPAPVYNKTRIKFKGYDLGMCASLTLPQLIDGIVYIPIGQLINFIGGDVERTKGKIKIGVYGKTSEFTENSATVITQYGEYEMEAPCLRLLEDQLFEALVRHQVLGPRHAARQNEDVRSVIAPLVKHAVRQNADAAAPDDLERVRDRDETDFDTGSPQQIRRRQRLDLLKAVGQKNIGFAHIISSFSDNWDRSRCQVF